MSSWETLIIQLGIAGAVLLLGYKLALVLIEKWSEGDLARTEAHITSERERTLAIAAGFAQITTSHSQLAEQARAIEVGLERLDAKVATVLDLTPVRGVKIPSQNVIVEGEIETSGDKKATPVAGVKIPRSVTSG